MIEAGFEALGLILEPSRLVYVFLGTGIGMVIGILPGLGGAVGMAILLPFVFGMDPISGVALLMGMSAVTTTSDSFPSILLGVPGTSGSQATIMDGYPMSQRGESSRALGAAFSSSIIGGVFGAAMLFATLSIARPLILALGSPELFMLSLLGLSAVAVLVRGAPTSGLLGGAIGLMLGTIGFAPATPEVRYFIGEWTYLLNGIPIAIVALSLFAVPEIIDLLVARRSVTRAEYLEATKGQNVLTGMMQGVRDTLSNKLLVFRSALIGTAVGFAPGLGGSVVDWLAYGAAKQSVKNNTFGEGDVRGVIAPESANNAKEGGGLIPTLLFGIPGSASMAILLGGFLLLGIQPGPTMLTTNLSLTLSIVWTLVIANIAAGFLCFVITRPVSHIVTISMSKLAPFLLVIMAIAVFQSSRTFGDIALFVGIGIVAWFLKQVGIPRPPIMIGFVLSGPIERYLHISISRYGWEWLMRPGVIILGLITLLIVVVAIKQATTQMSAFAVLAAGDKEPAGTEGGEE